MPVRPLRTFALLVAAAVLAGAAVAPVAAQAEEPGTVTVTAQDYYFEGLPTSVPVGTQLALTNAGTEFHELALARINDDVTESLEELLALPEAEVMTKVTIMQPLFAAAGTTAEGTLSLDQEGRYVALCSIPQGTAGTIELPDPAASPDPSFVPEGLGEGPPHMALGMIQEFTVTAPGSTPGPLLPVTGTPAETGGEARTIELEETVAMQIVQDGTQVTSLNVAIGETIRFVITNTAGFDHNFYIGTPDQLANNQVDGLPGVPANQQGVQEFIWTVPENAAELEFACTVAGHYTLMKGNFVVGG